MKGKVYHISTEHCSVDAAGADFQVSDYISLIITSAVA